MKENDSTNWAIGCKIFQWRVNTQYHATTKSTPYTLTFGMQPTAGILSLPLSKDVLQSLRTKSELNKVYNELEKSTSDIVENIDMTELDVNTKNKLDKIQCQFDNTLKKLHLKSPPKLMMNKLPSRRKLSSDDLKLKHHAKNLQTLALTKIKRTPSEDSPEDSSEEEFEKATTPTKSAMTGRKVMTMINYLMNGWRFIRIEMALSWHLEKSETHLFTV